MSHREAGDADLKQLQKSSHKTFLQSNSREQSETLTSFLMRKQTSCLIELGKGEDRVGEMVPRRKPMSN